VTPEKDSKLVNMKLEWTSVEVEGYTVHVPMFVNTRALHEGERLHKMDAETPEPPRAKKQRHT